MTRPLEVISKDRDAWFSTSRRLRGRFVERTTANPFQVRESSGHYGNRVAPVETLSLLEQMSAEAPAIRLKAAAAEMMLGFDRSMRDVEKLHSDSRDQLLSCVDIFPSASPKREQFFENVQNLIDLAEG
jgi:hypothetical protein